MVTPSLRVYDASSEPRSRESISHFEVRKLGRIRASMLLRDDRVRMFDQNLLRKLEDKGYITPPFCRPGSHGRSVGDMSLTFPFTFWEAKREGGGSDHQSAETQNAIKVKLMLHW